MTPADKRPRRIATRLAHAGLDPRAYHGFVNPPVVRASTVLYPDTDALVAHRARYTYGRRGTPTTEALTGAWSELEGAAGTVLTPSGLSACSLALLAVLSAGDEVLVSDSVYRPTRTFCDTVLARLGIRATYVDPRLGAEITALIGPRTRAVYLESPGSLTFEVQDAPAIVAAARERGALVLLDNTWATPLFFRPLEIGVDISIQAGTKYLGGHSDVNMGLVAAAPSAWKAVRDLHGTMGLTVSGDEAALALRGFRTMGVRLQQHQENGLAVARWLATRPEVAKVLHPALPSHPDHALWQRDFAGASGLFGVVLKPVPMAAVAAMLDGLALFGLGYSWGGFESLAIVSDPRAYRTATPWEEPGPLLRFHIGLEDPEDLIADLDEGFSRLARVAKESAAA